MASSGVMADFARMPTGRKVLVFAVIAFFLGLLYFRFGLKSLREDLDQAEQAYNAKVAEAAALEQSVPVYKHLKESMRDLNAKINENQKALPTEAEVPAFFETLERKVGEAGVEITSWKKRNEEPIENFVKVPVEIEIVGTFMEIKRFFASLIQKPVAKSEERERIVSIENLVLGNPQIKNKEIVLQAKFLAVTYRQEDHPAPAAPAAGTPGQQAPATGPRPTAPAKPVAPSNTAPMPSASTPAGAKARVEDSMKKSEERLDKGLEKSGAGSSGGSDRLKGGL
jgi:Tfp pilus assembly protein PilO